MMRKRGRIVAWYDKAAAAVFVAGLLAYTLACVISPVSWSPDGRWIALTRFAPQEDSADSDEVAGCELWIVSPKPIERHRLLVTSESLLSAPAWSGDGGVYVVETPSDTSTATVVLWRVARDGSPQKVVEVEPHGDTEGVLWTRPAPAPDGSRIAFIRDESTVVVARADGSIEREIACKEPIELAWSPDGTWLTIRKNENSDEPWIRCIDPRTSETLALDKTYFKFTWLPNGDHALALKVFEGDAPTTPLVAVVQVKGGLREISAQPLQLGDETGVEDLVEVLSTPMVFSPKGDAVFLARKSSGEKTGAILRFDLRTGQAQILYESLTTVIPCDVSPDGRGLAFREGAPPEKNGEDMSVESVVGVLDLEGKAEPLYLAVDDRQWAAMIGPYAEELARLAPAIEKPHQRELARLGLDRLDRFVAAFERDFPKSERLAKCNAAFEQVREALKAAGVK